MAVTADYELEIDGLSLGAGTDYVVQTVEGFGAPTDRVGDSPRPRDHGLFYGLDFLNGRTVTITLTVVGDTGADVMANIDALLAKWQPISVDAFTVSPLTFQLPGQSPRSFRGRPRRAKVDTANLGDGFAPVTLEYVAADPLQYAADGSSGTVGMATSSGGRTYNRTYNRSYGTSGSVFLFAVHAGTFPTKPVLTIAGPAANPHIENLTTGQIMRFDLVVAAGDTLVVDTDARTILLNGTASRYSSLSADSEWISMPPGSNTFRFIADVYEPGASLTVDWASAWL